MIALSNSIHLYARTDCKKPLLDFFATTLGLEIREAAKAYISSSEPMYAVSFSNDQGLSIEFTDDALSDQEARRGAWLELRTDDPAGLRQRVQDLGFHRVIHPYTPFFYFQAPGGQVFRIAAAEG